MSRIKLTDSPMDIIVKMAEGNPGAAVALTEMFTKGGAIDPEAMFEGLAPILTLDTLEIYGSSIYVLYSDKCGKDLRKLVMLLRAYQLGFLCSSKLQEMAADQEWKVNLTDEEYAELDAQVCEALPNFMKES